MGLAFALGVLPSWSEVWHFLNHDLGMPTNPAEKAGDFVEFFQKNMWDVTKSYGHCLGFRFQAHVVPGFLWLQEGIDQSIYSIGGRGGPSRTHEIRRFALHFLVAATVSVSNSLGIDFFCSLWFIWPMDLNFPTSQPESDTVTVHVSQTYGGCKPWRLNDSQNKYTYSRSVSKSWCRHSITAVWSDLFLFFMEDSNHVLTCCSSCTSHLW